MITAIREVRRARGLTLDQLARACDPPTTAQTIGRLETGTRTVSLAWLSRIAAALGVDPGDLVRLPDRPDIAVAAILSPDGVRAPTRPQSLPLPVAPGDTVAVLMAAGTGDYRAGDQLWCRRIAPGEFHTARNRDILVPRAAGRFAFGRLIDLDDRHLRILPPGAGSASVALASPAWIAVAATLVRSL
ncbi:helix-turn-helix domain-containing protein [Sphingomonas sp.]